MEKSNTSKRISEKPSKNRLLWGGIVFISGFLSPLLIPLVLSAGLSVGIKTALSGLLAFGIPELFMLIAAGIMGKSGFNYIKRYLMLLLRRYGPPDKVGITRYRIGLIMFLIPIFLALVLPYLFSFVAFISAYYLEISISSDILLILSLFVLGGDFWDKLQGLFNRNARIQIKSKEK